MPTLTAIELGADTCAFARTTVRRGDVHLSAAEILDPAAFPGADAFTVAVRQTRRALRLPRRCRVVVWGLPDGANRKDAAVKPLIAPLTNAGFRVERVVSPCNALAALARLKTSRVEGSTCWLAINRGGVAIVVIRPGKLIYAHSFAWDSSVGASGSQARLLQRYSLVSFLAPEVKRAMAEARKSGTPIYAVVTCGNIPDLRSLTMPLIEELDVEVETLDSFEGLTVKPPLTEKLADSASSIRLACAAAIARGTRPWDPSKKRSAARVRRYLYAAAILAAILGVAYQWYAKTSTAPVVPAPAAQQARAQAPPPTIENRGSRIGQSPPPVTAPITTPKPAVVTPPAGPTSITPSRTEERDPRIGKPAVTLPPPAAPTTEKPRNDPRPSVSPSRIEERDPRIGKPAVTLPPAAAPATEKPRNDPRPSALDPRTPIQPLVTLPKPNVQAPAPPAAKPSLVATAKPAVPEPVFGRAGPQPRPSGPAAGTALNTPAVPTDKPQASEPPKRPESKPPAVSEPAKKPESKPPAVSEPAKKPESKPPAVSEPAKRPESKPLKDAVPRVTAILVSRDRRFATVDGGHIIGIGDLLGRRTVVGMDERSVVLQEPSGLQIRVGLGGHLLGIDRPAR